MGEGEKAWDEWYRRVERILFSMSASACLVLGMPSDWSVVSGQCSVLSAQCSSWAKLSCQ